MKVLLTPQRNDEKIAYSYNGETVSATYKGTTCTFDFSSVLEGDLPIYDINGQLLISNTLEINPISSVSRENGELSVTLLNFIGAEATDEEKFPQWVTV